MARFVFRLEPVLRQRRREEDACKRRLAGLVRREERMHEQLRQMQAELSGEKRQMADSLVGRVDVDQIRRHGAHHAQVTQRAQGIVRHLAGLSSQIEQARTELAEATRRRQAIERLRERQRQQWVKRQRRAEAAAADELATQRHGGGWGDGGSERAWEGVR